VIIADLTNLQNRGLVNGLVTAPFIPNGFIAGFITSGISGTQGENWRWGVSHLLILALGMGLIAVWNVCHPDPNLDGSVYRRSLLGSMESQEAWSYGNCRSWVRTKTDFSSKQSSKASTRDSKGFVLAD
jgi:MFS family permease